jgi:glycosyltransferase involved in cell wall biosynthesis
MNSLQTAVVAPCKQESFATGAPPRRLRVGVPCFASDGGRSGIGQYLVNVVRRLPQAAPGAEFVVFAPRRDAHLWNNLPAKIEVEWVADLLDSPLPSLAWHSTVLARRLKAHGCNVVFLPSGNRRLGLAYGVPSVATVHDLSQLHVAQKYDFARMVYATRILPRLIGRQDRIITVSSSTRTDVLAHTSATAEHVSVVPNGVDLSRYGVAEAGRPAAGRPATDQPYILYVARLEHPGKNHVTLLEAYAHLRKEGFAQKLVLAGPPWNGAEAITDAVARLGLQDDVILTGFVANEDLPALYANASAFVFPSLFEGFGIPLLEAMASGTPCCVANTSSLPEVAGDAALLFDPLDPQAMADAMRRLLTDDLLRARLRAAGLQRVREFTWERAARGVIDACQSAVASCS